MECQHPGREAAGEPPERDDAATVDHIVRPAGEP
jgi:hypothetical protein